MNTELAPSAVIVLAAGAGTRMKSATPKVMHGIGGRSMVEHAIAAARDLNPERSASLLWYVTSAIRLLSMCLRLTLR